jgi:hypothetical protein
MMIYAQLGRLDEARAAAAGWLKTGFHSVLAETCVPIREPMKQKYLNDLRKAGVAERASLSRVRGRKRRLSWPGRG